MLVNINKIDVMFLCRGGEEPYLLNNSDLMEPLCFRCCQQKQTDLTGIVQRNSVDPSHHYFRSVFIHGTLTVSHIWDIFDNHLKENRDSLSADACKYWHGACHLSVFASLSLTQWSGFSPGSYSIGLDWTMSSTTLLLEISLERNCCGADRFFPSLLPRWL